MPASFRWAAHRGYEDEGGDFLLGLAFALPLSLTLWTIIILAGQWLLAV